MTCALEPARICRCCEVGKPCAHVLQLDAKAISQLKRIEWIVGDKGWPVTLRTKQTEREVKQDQEPTTIGECPTCGNATQIYTYIADFLALHGAKWPRCEECSEGKKRAA